jgi:hypothetical protein
MGIGSAAGPTGAPSSLACPAPTSWPSLESRVHVRGSGTSATATCVGAVAPPERHSARLLRGGFRLASPSCVSPSEAADRLAIRELVEAYAHCADRRDAKGQMSLFTVDTHFVVYMNAKDPTSSQELHSREALAPVFAVLNQYDATTHFVGQTTISTLSDDRATGEAYCLAHHVTVDGSKRRLMVASLRYNDTFVKTDGAWLFSERLLYVDWVDERALS